MEKNLDESHEKIIQEIEEETEKKTRELFELEKKKKFSNEGLENDFEKKLEEIMSDGDKNFQKRTGRRMTYNEMRTMFG